MVFQEFDQLLPWKTVLENVMFPLLVTRRLPRKEAEERGARLYREGRPDPFADAYPHTLSGGMKQRVAIARGMAMEPDILLMDEPFAALDALTRRQLQDELLQLWDETRNSPCCSSPIRSRRRSRSATASCCCRRIPAGSRPRCIDVDQVSGGDGSAARLEKQIHRSAVRRAATAHMEGAPMGEATDPAARPAARGRRRPAEVERKLDACWSCCGTTASSARPLIIVFLARRLGGLRHASSTIRCCFRPSRHHRRRCCDALRDGTMPMRAWASLKVLFMGYAAGITLAAHLHHPGDLHPDRHRLPRDHDGDVQSAAGDRAVAAGADLVRPRQWQPGVRADPFGAVAGRAQHPFRLQERVAHAAHGRAQLRPARACPMSRAS